MSGCFQYIANFLILLTETNFCHACKCLRVYSMYKRTIDALYFRYGEKYTGKGEREEKRKAHDIPSAFPAFSRFVIAFVHLYLESKEEGKNWQIAPCS